MELSLQTSFLLILHPIRFFLVRPLSNVSTGGNERLYWAGVGF